MRLARDIGDITSLFPPGIEKLVDLPFKLHEAINTALTFLSFEQLPKEERPHKRIWLDAEALDRHWDSVLQARENKAKGHGDLQGMAQNDLVKSIMVG